MQVLMSLCLHMISYDKQFLLSTNTPIFFFLFFVSINMDCVKMKSLTGSKDVFPFLFQGSRVRTCLWCRGCQTCCPGGLRRPVKPRVAEEPDLKRGPEVRLQYSGLQTGQKVSLNYLFVSWTWSVCQVDLMFGFSKWSSANAHVA